MIKPDWYKQANISGKSPKRPDDFTHYLESGELMRPLSSLALGLVVVIFACGFTDHQSHLVTLQRLGRSDASDPRFPVDWRFPTIHQSRAIFSGYVDRTYETPWIVYFHYRRCPATRQGAFQLTVFVGREEPSNHGFVPHLPKGAVQYSHTLVDRRTGDDATYGFPAKPAITYYYRVVIPNRRGCRRWQIGTRGN